MMKRRKSREIAFELFYAFELSGDTKEKVLQRFSSIKNGTDKEIYDYAVQLFNWTVDSNEDLDREITKTVKNWSLDRLSKVDKSLIYLACTEIKKGGTPASVVINEFVELAKTFGDKNSPGFINGIIDSWHKKG